MPAIALTETKIKTLKPQSDRYEVSDAAHPGLALRVLPTGRRVFFVWASEARADGKAASKRITLGEHGKGEGQLSLADARRRALEVKNGTGANQDEGTQRRLAPRRAHQPPPAAAAPVESEIVLSSAPTFAALVELYLEEMAVSGRLRPSTVASYRRALKSKHLADWQDRPADRITPQDVARIRNQVRSQGRKGKGAPIMANRVLSAVSACYAWAVKEPSVAVTANPAAGVPPAAPPRKRRRALSAAEIKRVWAAVTTADTCPQVEIAFKLLLLTAQRKGTVLRLTPWQVSDDALWRIPDEHMKSGRQHLLPLSPQAHRLVQRAAEARGASRWLLPSERLRTRKQLDSRISDWTLNSLLARLLDRGDPVKGRDPGPLADLEPFTIHDLRRTAATLLAAELKVPPHVLSRLLDHRVGDAGGGSSITAEIYDTYEYLTEKGEALKRWGEWLEALVGPIS